MTIFSFGSIGHGDHVLRYHKLWLYFCDAGLERLFCQSFAQSNLSLIKKECSIMAVLFGIVTFTILTGTFQQPHLTDKIAFPMISVVAGVYRYLLQKEQFASESNTVVADSPRISMSIHHAVRVDQLIRNLLWH